jgi:hypothetical protein
LTQVIGPAITTSTTSSEALLTKVASRSLFSTIKQSKDGPRTGGLAQNTCAFVSALNLVAQGTWKEQLKVRATDWGKHLVTAIRGVGVTENELAAAVEEIVEADQGGYLRPLGTHTQDPFVVLQLVTSMLEAMDMGGSKEPTHPVWGCACGRQGSTTVLGPLDYIRTGPQRYEAAKPNCSACGGFGETKEFHLPQ